APRSGMALAMMKRKSLLNLLVLAATLLSNAGASTEEVFIGNPGNDRGVNPTMTTVRAICFLALITCLGHLPFFTRPALSAEMLQRVRIAYASRSSSAMPQYMAQSKGWYKAEGLEVELIQMNPRLGATAVVNGDVSFATPFVSTFRGVVQGLPMKLVLVHLKKGPYYVMARPDIKDLQQLKGKKLGVATIKGADQLVAEELLQAKGFNPALLQVVAIGEAPVRMQALVSGAVEAVCVSPPHDLLLKRMGFPALAGPPEIGLPVAGMFTSDRLLRENPQLVRRTLKALLRAHQYILENKQETIQVLLKWLPQPPDIADHSYEVELKTLARDGQMTDAEVESLINRLGEKKRPLDEVRDFSYARQAMKELQ
ncbi:MAG TPA: ABC transporter substrate-binding protein, partial [Methylomirabilota bacterium]|nr:ABC transporter substrate-binding protein [Methylomirabilota bacterium]